ncbi:hypothetical protein HPG69_010413 [Diceros bicornis minor]|uniref:Uncharacterized protein n=1 Tax=Diceros bicornis minor TaxID=77932 RepID=A0A7J7F7L0_DICBM|nr:hypothetical protein HPG69_010413 [Diceros bicornis minor]
MNRQGVEWGWGVEGGEETKLYTLLLGGKIRMTLTKVSSRRGGDLIRRQQEPLFRQAALVWLDARQRLTNILLIRGAVPEGSCEPPQENEEGTAPIHRALTPSMWSPPLLGGRVSAPALPSTLRVNRRRTPGCAQRGRPARGINGHPAPGRVAACAPRRGRNKACGRRRRALPKGRLDNPARPRPDRLTT